MAALDCLKLDDLIILKINGSLTAEEIAQVEQPFAVLTAQPGARIVVDLTNVEIVTTPALSMFIAAANHAKHSGGKLVFTHATPPVRDILHRLRLSAILITVPGLDEAIAQARA